MADSPRRSVRPQKARARTFRYSDDSRPGNKVPRDDRTLKPNGPQVEIVRPKWTGAGPTTFRPFPMFCAEDPNGPFDPTRLSLDPFDFSDFWRGLPAAKYVGIEHKFTFITYDPRWPRENGYNPRRDNPYHVLFNAIKDAVADGKALVRGRNVLDGSWAPLTLEGPKKAFNAPTKLYFLQGALFEHDGEILFGGKIPPKGLGQDDLPQIIQISKTAGADLAAKLNTLDPDYGGDTVLEAQAVMYKYGDLTNLANGSFITFYNPDKHDVSEGAGADDGDTPRSSREFKSWSVAINKNFYYVRQRQSREIGPDITQYEDVIRDRLVWWDDILHVPSAEEIAVWMAQAFGEIPDLLRFGWADNPEFFTDEVNGILTNRSVMAAADVPHDDEEDVTTASRRPEPEPERAPPVETPRTKGDGVPQHSVALPSDDADDISAADEEAFERAAAEAEARRLASKKVVTKDPPVSESGAVPKRKVVKKKVVRKKVKKPTT